MNRYYDHKVGDLLLLKSGRKVSRWTIIQVEEQGFRAKNLATRRTRKFTADSKHIIIPPDAEVPESLRKQIPRNIGVCRAPGLRYKLYSKTELEVIDIQQESVSVISFDFAVEDGEPAWNLAEEKTCERAQQLLCSKRGEAPRPLDFRDRGANWRVVLTTNLLEAEPK